MRREGSIDRTNEGQFAHSILFVERATVVFSTLQRFDLKVVRGATGGHRAFQRTLFDNC